MNEENKDHSPSNSPPEKSKQSAWAVPMIVVIVIGVALAIFYMRDPEKPSSAPTLNSQTAQSQPGAAPAAVTTDATAPPGETQTMQVAQAVMVTADLAISNGPPTIPNALAQIERRYGPFDGQGRTFAVLDAYGETTPDGKLHISMHVSSEKPGTGSLVFKPTGEVLWSAEIKGTPVSATRNLTVYIGDGVGGSWIIDGSGNPATVFDAKVRDKNNMLVRNFWPDGAEREVTFIYSACGCPVKAMVKRVGDRSVRTSELPVMFPDDPPAIQVISRLMGWQA